MVCGPRVGWGRMGLVAAGHAKLFMSQFPATQGAEDGADFTAQMRSYWNVLLFQGSELWFGYGGAEQVVQLQRGQLLCQRGD